LENLDVEVDINRAWETVRENTNISAKEILGYYESKKHKPRHILLFRRPTRKQLIGIHSFIYIPWILTWLENQWL
jgi:hypothetical protein